VSLGPATISAGEEASVTNRHDHRAGTALVQTTLVVAAAIIVIALVVIAVAGQLGGGS
jgi:hypothetical protein